MKNRLENFVRDNQQAFDDQEPSSQLWHKIQQDLAQNTNPPARLSKTVPISRVWQVAAGFAVLLLFSLFLQRQFLQPKSVENLAKMQAEEIYVLNPELAETEQFYVQQIHLKRQEIRQYNFKDKEFEQDLQALEKLYDKLKADLIQSGNSEQVLSAMIQNLQLRAEILNQQIELLKQIQEFQNTNQNEKVSNI